MPTFDIKVKFITKEVEQQLDRAREDLETLTGDIEEGEEQLTRFQADTKEVFNQTQASIRSLITKVRRVVQLTSFFLEAAGMGIDQSLLYLAEAAILTVEFAMNLKAILASTSPVGWMEIAQGAAQLVLIVSLIELYARLQSERKEGLEAVRARVSFLRGISFRQTYFG